MKKLKASFSSKIPLRLEVQDFCDAAMTGDKKTVMKLLKKFGMEIVDEKDFNGKMALACAAWNGHGDIVELLLKNGADIEKRDSSNMTALMHAAWDGHKNTAFLLLKKGASFQSVDNDGWTAEAYAWNGGHHETAELLAQWPKMQLQEREQQLTRELDAITKTIMGGLPKAIPYKNPFGYKPPAGKGSL